MTQQHQNQQPGLDSIQADSQEKGHRSIPETMSLDFLEHVLKGLPSNIFLKDDQCRYVFATQYWDHFENRGDNWTIRGKTDLDIRRNKQNAQKAMEQDRAILTTGKGTVYTVPEEIDGAIEYFEVVKSPVFGEDGSVIGVVGLVNNVTEKELMRKELERMAVTDPMTGLLNRHYFSQLLETELDEDQYPVAVFLADCDRLKVINDTYGHSYGNDFICQTAQLLKSTLPENALIFRTGGDEFVAIAPQMNSADMQSTVSKLKENQEGMTVKDHAVTISVGASLVMSRETPLRKIVQHADFLMYVNKAEAHSLENHLQFGTE